ncbi:MAG: PD-(D/E)XK nuclease family protein [Thermoplasmata archaeon]
MGFSPPIPDLFGFGRTIHAALGKLHESFPESVPSAEEAQSVATDIFHLKHVPPSSDPEERPGPYERARDKAAEITGTYADDFADDFRYKRQLEVRFEAPFRGGVIAGSIDLLTEYDAEGNIVDASVIDFKAIEMGPEERPKAYDWTELALQVQLYAMAATEVLGKNARTGKVHFLKDSERVEVPISDEAILATLENLEWATDRILASDFPMRPAERKCKDCDWKDLCPKVPQEFATDTRPPPIHVPTGEGPMMILAFREFEGGPS